MAQVLLKPGMDAIPRTQMRYDFDLERRLLAEDGGGASSNPCAPTFASAAKSASPSCETMKLLQSTVGAFICHTSCRDTAVHPPVSVLQTTGL